MAKSEYDSKKGMPKPKGMPVPMKGGAASGVGRLERSGSMKGKSTADQKPGKKS